MTAQPRWGAHPCLNKQVAGSRELPPVIIPPQTKWADELCVTFKALLMKPPRDQTRALPCTEHQRGAMLS